MAYKLKNRNMQIPGGYKFLQPETGWRPGNFQSFEVIVSGLMNHRRSRPDLVAQNGWATDHDNVANDVERFNVALCQQHGWSDYIEGGELGDYLPPKPKALSPGELLQVSAAANRAKKIWSGVKTLQDWITSGSAPVVPELSKSRAEICSNCPKNQPGGFESWFTAPAAGAIKRQIEQLAERKLATPSDTKLNICEVCLCPLKLKVHTPIEFIKAQMSEEVLKDLQAVPGCWIPAECFPQ